jgi:hypothetical protein
MMMGWFVSMILSVLAIILLDQVGRLRFKAATLTDLLAIQRDLTRVALELYDMATDDEEESELAGDSVKEKP